MNLQLKILLYLQNIRTPLLTTIFLLFTMSIETPIVILFSSILYWSINKTLGTRLLFTLCNTLSLNTGLKEIIKYTRPIGSNGLTSIRVKTATGYSLPSGHSQTAASFWTLLMINIKKSWIYIIGTIAILGVSLSRLYLGVHWPTDILLGIFLGILCTLLCNIIFNYITQTKKTSILIYSYIPFIILSFFFTNELYIKILGLQGGMILGYIIEQKYVQFNTNTTLINKFLRVILGVISLAVLYLILNFIMPEILIFVYIKHFLLCLYAIAFVPYLFNLLEI